MEISPDAHMGLVELSVSDLDRSLAYWQDAIGLRVLSRENGTAELGTDTPLVRFVEEPGARPAQGFTGLFHVALLVPDRPSLGRFLAHAARERIPLTGLSDHVVSEAIYLRDPDYHGIEVYADRPREQWEGRVAQTMTTIPLDTDSLLAEAGDADFDGLPDGTTVGHVHLTVRDVDETVGFYRDKLGMGLTAHGRRPGRLPQRRRLPPPPRRQHVGDARRGARARGNREAAPLHDRPPGRRGSASAWPSGSAAPRSATPPGTRSSSSRPSRPPPSAAS